MRALTCLFILACAAPAAAAPVVTTWGMSPDDVAVKAKSLGSEVDPVECPGPFKLVPFQTLVGTTSKETDWNHTAQYLFDQSGLVAVREGSTSKDVCTKWEAELVAAYGAGEKLTGDTDLTWKNPANGEGARLTQYKSGCERWTSSKAVVDAGYKVFTPAKCFQPLEFVERQSGELSSTRSCTSTTDLYFSIRPLRIAQETDLHFWLSIDKPGMIDVYGPTGERVATEVAKKGVWHEANFRQKLSKGCHLVQIKATEPKVATEYRLEIVPYADWKANDDLKREEELGEEPDNGPPTAPYPAIILGGATPYYGGTTHLSVTGAVGFLDAGNMYGMNTQLGFELSRHPRVRGIVGASLGILYQPLDDQWSTTNTMFPLSLWGGARASVRPNLFAQARLGLLGYYISADANEQMLGAYDRSETGSGYVFGLDLIYGPLVVGLEQMFLSSGVTTLRLGFGF